MENAPVTTDQHASLPTVTENIQWAKIVATELVKIVDSAGMARKFGGDKKHLEYEAWQFIAAMDGTTPSISKVRPGNGGFIAEAELIDKRGEVIARAEASCMPADEPNWRNKPEYAIRSMAQTRALSKVCRVKYAWIARLGGYSPTPAEEIASEFNRKREEGKSKKTGKTKQEPPSERPKDTDAAPDKTLDYVAEMAAKKVIGAKADDIRTNLPAMNFGQAKSLLTFVAETDAIEADVWLARVEAVTVTQQEKDIPL